MPVDRRWCFVHATHMTGAETAEMAARGVVAGLCPITEANLGDGLFPAIDFLVAGGCWGIGSDSNVLINMAEELRLFEYGQRLMTRSRTMLAPPGASCGASLYRGALVGGAQALGAPAGLAIDAPADFVTLDRDHPALAARSGDALLDGLVFAARQGAIDSIWRRGRRVVAAGRHFDRACIVNRYRRTLAEIVE
jgi:formiminoglutamate deiminase